MRGLFVTGTDTGVGKTYVACLIIRALRARGREVGALKPVATGAERVGGQWLSDDTRRLGDAAGSDDYRSISPWVFPEPLAPSVAARRHGVALNVERIAAAVREQAAPNADLVVEGIGGLLCPLNESETVADLIAALGLPALVVTRNVLGTLNHTLLTLEVAASRGLPVAGVIVNETTPSGGLAERTNAEELRRLLRVPILAELPFRRDGAASRLPRDIPWEQYFGAPRR
jgi:dethiobiotin synthetase